MKLTKEDIKKYGTEEEKNFLSEIRLRRGDIPGRPIRRIVGKNRKNWLGAWKKTYAEYSDDPNADPEWVNGAISALEELKPKLMVANINLAKLLPDLYSSYNSDPNANPEWVNGALDSLMSFANEIGIDLEGE